MKLCVLGSGSSGNAVLVQGGGATVLVDAGLSLRETRRRMEAVGLGAAGIDAVLLTHEHADHVAHVARISRAFDAPVHTGGGTREAAGRHFERVPEWVPLEGGREVRIGALAVLPVPKPHDAAEPLSFLVSHGGQVVGVFTDQGHVDGVTAEAMRRCTALVLESNHDPSMLAAGPYPQRLKRRVGGRLGHLSNEDAARAVARAAPPRLGLLVLAHLSRKNNRPELAREASLRVLGRRPGFPRWLSRQDRPTPLLEVEGARGAASAPATSSASR